MNDDAIITWKGIRISRKAARESLANRVVSCKNALKIAQGKLARNADPYQSERLEWQVEGCLADVAVSEAAFAAF